MLPKILRKEQTKREKRNSLELFVESQILSQQEELELKQKLETQKSKIELCTPRQQSENITLTEVELLENRHSRRATEIISPVEVGSLITDLEKEQQISKFIKSIDNGTMKQNLEKILMEVPPQVILCIAETAQVQDKDEVIKALVTIYESNRKAVNLLKYALTFEIRRTPAVEMRTIFRQTTFITKLCSQYFFLIGKSILRVTVSPVVNFLASLNSTLEIDPNRLPNQDVTTTTTTTTPGSLNQQEQIDLKHNFEILQSLVKLLLVLLEGSIKSLPKEIQLILVHLRKEVSTRLPKISTNIVGAFIFHRFLCPGLVSPHKYDISPQPSLISQRALILVSKVLLALSTGIPFDGNKEPYMTLWNPFVKAYTSPVQKFLRIIASDYEEDNHQPTTHDLGDQSYSYDRTGNDYSESHDHPGDNKEYSYTDDPPLEFPPTITVPNHEKTNSLRILWNFISQNKDKIEQSLRNLMDSQPQEDTSSNNLVSSFGTPEQSPFLEENSQYFSEEFSEPVQLLPTTTDELLDETRKENQVLKTTISKLEKRIAFLLQDAQKQAEIIDSYQKLLQENQQQQQQNEILLENHSPFNNEIPVNSCSTLETPKKVSDPFLHTIRETVDSTKVNIEDSKKKPPNLDSPNDFFYGSKDLCKILFSKGSALN